MKTQPELIKQFDAVIGRLQKRGITVRADGSFHLSIGEGETFREIGAPETTDGLTAFADALDYAHRA